MFKKFAVKHNLILKKGENLYIFWHLLVNYVLLGKLKISKWIRGIKKPIVHYYALCWNEERMLPFVFDYYGKFVDRFIIFDNYSNDKSEVIVISHDNARMIKFKTDGFNDVAHIGIKNNCWKKSRGKADYVVVCDMDEFIYHPQIEEFLMKSMQDKISFFHPVGYDMYHDVYPKFEIGNYLPRQVKKGYQCDTYSKCILFDPHRIVEVNYWLGAHESRPLGIVKMPSTREPLKLLHYKNLSVEHVLERIRLYRERLSEQNIKNDCGVEYLKDEEKIVAEFNNHYSECKIVVE